MSAANDIQEQLAATLQRAQIEAQKADAAAEVATFEDAKGIIGTALRKEASEMRKIKPKPVKAQCKDGESTEAAEARAHQARALAAAEAEVSRAEKMEGMHPIAKQLDTVMEHLGSAKGRLAALMGQRGDTA